MGTLERARAGRQMFSGAHLTEVVGDDHHGVVNVRLGVLAARFTGQVRFEPDLDRHRIIVKAGVTATRGEQRRTSPLGSKPSPTIRRR